MIYYQHHVNYIVWTNCYPPVQIFFFVLCRTIFPHYLCWHRFHICLNSHICMNRVIFMQCAVHGDLVAVSWTRRIWKMEKTQWNQRKWMMWTSLIQVVPTLLWFCNQKVELGTPQMKPRRGKALISQVSRYRACFRGDCIVFKSTILEHQCSHWKRSLMEEGMAWFCPNGLQQLTTAATFVFDGEGNGFLVQVIAPKPRLCCDQIQLATTSSMAICFRLRDEDRPRVWLQWQVIFGS